jgi:hypothetical protein
MADAVWEAGDAIGGLIKGMCDAALIAGLAAIGGTVTAATGVGAAVGYGIAAVETAIIEPFSTWRQAEGAGFAERRRAVRPWPR